MKTTIALSTLLLLAACGGGDYELTVKAEESAAQDDALRCGIGSYYVPPASGAASTDRGYCMAYPQRPASAP